jgi:hypothetical protein
VNTLTKWVANRNATTMCVQDHPGWNKWGVSACPKNAKHCHDAVSLWLGRVRYLSKLIDLGYNPMYLDTDFTAQDNFYKHLRSGSAAAHSLFFMREGQVRSSRPYSLPQCFNCRFLRCTCHVLAGLHKSNA